MALDVAHTGGVGAWADVDLVVDEPALTYWLAVLLAREVTSEPGLEEFRRLREAMFHCGRNHVEHRPFRRGDVETLNRLATGPCLATAIDVAGNAVLPPVNVDQALAHIAREGIAVLTGPLRTRIRQCAAQDCQLLFVDTSRPGQRRWCSMSRCGNIAKTRAYRGRMHS